MEMKKINSGKLRAIGYDARARILQVQFDDGSTLQYSGVGEEIWRRLNGSGAAWSFYRDNIEEEFTVKRVSGSQAAGLNPLDGLFIQKPDVSG
ncbi:MAG: KTSC domain-containing protein [Nitrosomonadales bacterium]|nr:KTSC domain-containing protein [Nitrosomonadales bacterium]